ncbi:MAG: YihY/virulence factor BrkB family protein [Clostridia bacterium]|nr:YihY/virulence factor BrkB family protein [Clostridia bacterium]
MNKLCVFFKRLGKSISRFFSMLTEDQISVYAAQAAFFIIVSAVPFIILLIGLARYIIDIDWLLNLIDNHISGQIGRILTSIVTEIVDKTGASLVSITLVAVLWSASRGVFSVTRGIAGAYGVHLKENFLLDILRSFIYTLSFILIIILSLVALVFADLIVDTAREHLPMFTHVMDIVNDCAPVILTVVLTLFFTFIFDTVSRKGRSFSKKEYKGLSGKLPRGFLAQLPGAGFAALGWVLASHFFSIYLRYFPDVSYLYGSLTTLMLLMLWIYCCMFILMLGAEVNKTVFNKWNIGKLHSDYVIKKKRRKKALSRVRTYSTSFGRKKKQ